MIDGKTFTVTAEHLTLANRMFVGWDDCEFGAPAIDPKRPYGNSDVVGDIYEMLIDPSGWNADLHGGRYLEEADEELYERLRSLHHEMRIVVQILLIHAGEAVEPGTSFRKGDRYNDVSWKRV